MTPPRQRAIVVALIAAGILLTPCAWVFLYRLVFALPDVLTEPIDPHCTPHVYSRSMQDSREKGWFIAEAKIEPASFVWDGVPIRIREAWIEQEVTRQYDVWLNRIDVKGEYQFCFTLDYPHQKPFPQSYAEWESHYHDASYFVFDYGDLGRKSRYANAEEYKVTLTGSPQVCHHVLVSPGIAGRHIRVRHSASEADDRDRGVDLTIRVLDK